MIRITMTMMTTMVILVLPVAGVVVGRVEDSLREIIRRKLFSKSSCSVP